jgi:hypothetical protein
MTKSNREQPAKSEKVTESEVTGKMPCLFLIHVTVSPESATAIENYVTVRGKMATVTGIETWNAVGFDSIGGGNGISYLKAGLSRATHALGLLAPENSEPWWLEQLPELVGCYSVEAAVLTLKGIVTVPNIPPDIEVLCGIKSLNEYLFRVSPDVGQIIFNNPEYGGLMAHTAPHHPLDDYLDWNQ